ncbi:hypothetical protein ACQPYK_25115 [Streptosporangium sp. CA-135522]
MSGPAALYSSADDTWPYNSIELNYNAVEPLRDALATIARPSSVGGGV